MWGEVKKFGLQYCDLPTMLWNVAFMLRALTLNIDSRNKTPIPIFVYLLCLLIALAYFFVYLVSMGWFVFVRCPETGDLLSAMIVFSLGVSSEIGTVKLVYMFMYIDKIKQIVTETLACDASVVPNSRFSNNLLTTLREVKKRAMIFWIVIISNGIVYVMKPILLPGRHLMEDKFILFVLEMSKKWRNIRDYYKKEKKRQEKEENNPKGPKTTKKRLYSYFQHLGFLDQQNYFRSNTTNVSDDESFTSGNDGPENQEQQEDEEEEEEEAIDIKIESGSQKRSLSKPVTPMAKRSVEASRRTQNNESHSEATRNFLLSLIPDVETLNEHQYMNFRLGVLNLLNSIKFENAECNNESWLISTLAHEEN